MLDLRWAQEVFLPYVADERHEPDSLIFYIEHDFRFHQRDDLAAEVWLPLMASQDPADVAWERHHARPTAEPLARVPPAEREEALPEGLRRGRFSGMLASSRPGTRDHGEVSEELADCVALCNAASRHGLGEFVWLSWNAGHASESGTAKRRSVASRINFGSQLLAFTPDGARLMAAAIASRRSPGGHLDHVLLDCVSKDETLRNCSSYVYPPIGGFSELHQSLNRDTRRRSPWECHWSRGGTNEYNQTPGKWGERRQIARFPRPGHTGLPSTVVAPHLPDVGGEWLWRTRLPPRGPADPDPQWQALLRVRGWIDDDGEWLGWLHQTQPPWWDSRAKGSGRGSRGSGSGGWHAPRHIDADQLLGRLPRNDYWRTLQESPHAPPVLGGVRQSTQLSALAYELACAPENSPGTWRHHERGATEMRWARQQYMMRFFVAAPDEAGPGVQ